MPSIILLCGLAEVHEFKDFYRFHSLLSLIYSLTAFGKQLLISNRISLSYVFSYSLIWYLAWRCVYCAYLLNKLLQIRHFHVISYALLSALTCSYSHTFPPMFLSLSRLSMICRIPFFPFPFLYDRRIYLLSYHTSLPCRKFCQIVMFFFFYSISFFLQLCYLLSPKCIVYVCLTVNSKKLYWDNMSNFGLKKCYSTTQYFVFL